MPHPVQILRAYAADAYSEVLQQKADAQRAVEEARQVGPRSALDVERALSELSVKDRAQIESETATTWASRAIASYTLAVRAPDRPTQVLRFSEGDEYSSEAREHAALVQDNGKTLAYVTGEMEKVRQQALGVAAGAQ